MEDGATDSLCPVWAYDLKNAALVTFDHTAHSAVLSLDPTRLLNHRAVTLKALSVDSVAARPMVDGFVFDLLKLKRAVARVEVSVNNGAISRVTVVQRDYSPLSVEAKMVPASTFLAFEPSSHLEAIRKVHEDLQTSGDVGYVPTAELCVSRGFCDIPLQPTTPEAEALWRHTCTFLAELSTRTADAVDLYNAAELRRVGASKLVERHASWRLFV